MGGSVLVVGSGAREHALVAGIAPDVGTVYWTQPNAGIADIPNAAGVDVSPIDIDGVARFAREHTDEDLLVVVGPERPLVQGLGNALREQGTPVFGPDGDAAMLEGSKIFATNFLDRHNIPRPDSMIVTDTAQARRVLAGIDPRGIVLKADGDAAGKGVVLPDDETTMWQVLEGMLSGRLFEGAGKRGVVIQERLQGPELSVFVVSDGRDFRVIPYFAQDHKRLEEGDRGPNTGGMGAYSPLPADMLTTEQLEKIEHIARATILGMQEEGIPYRGVLYMGLMLAEECNGDPVVIEYNCRFGDPEAQVILPLLGRAGIHIYDLFREAASGRVYDLNVPQGVGDAALTVVLAAEGYPDAPKKGARIRGLDRTYPNVGIYHGGTRRGSSPGDVLVSGGRVAAVTGFGPNIDAAAKAAYDAIDPSGTGQGVWFDGALYRTDVGWQARGPLR